MAQFFDNTKTKFSAKTITPKPSLVTTSSHALLASGILVLAIASIVYLLLMLGIVKDTSVSYDIGWFAYVNRLDKRAVVIPPAVRAGLSLNWF